MAALILTPRILAQDNTSVKFTFPKGHVIDFLLLKRKANSDPALNEYARAAIAEARALGYKGLGGFNIPRNPIQSNIHPETLIFGSWPGNFADRQQALKDLLAAVPTLYAKRLDVWSAFFMTNYEITEDITFEVDRDKIQVLTSYWQNDTDKFAAFKNAFLKKVNHYGGSVKLNLGNPQSPYGYTYTPDFTTLTEWNTQEEFDAFLESSRLMDISGVKQINQFYLEPPAPTN
jgi:heme-degrading monooxygenase HmoA